VRWRYLGSFCYLTHINVLRHFTLNPISFFLVGYMLPVCLYAAKPQNHCLFWIVNSTQKWNLVSEEMPGYGGKRSLSTVWQVTIFSMIMGAQLKLGHFPNPKSALAFVPIEFTHLKRLACIPSCLEIEIRRIEVWSQPWQIVHRDPISKITRAKWTGGVIQQ
jgi:hypothetical protein